MEVISEITGEKWQEILDRSDNPTFFHTKKWLDILTSSFGKCSDHSRIYLFDDGVEVLFPLVKFPYVKSMMKSYFSSYAGFYGGLIGTASLNREKADAITSKLFKPDTAGIYIYHSPFATIDLPERLKKKVNSTHIINLNQDFDYIWERCFSSNQRSKIRRAEKKGVRVIDGKSERDIKSFYDLYEKSVKRWGDKTTWVRPFEFCRNCVKIGSENTKLKLALLEDKIIAGAICHYYGNHMYYAWGAFDHDYRSCYPNNLVFKVLIQEACRDGIGHFDMGASAGLKGVAEFKESFGAVKTGYETYTWENPVYKLYSKVRKAI